MIIYIKLGIANYNQGYFINIKKSEEHLFGRHGDIVQAQLSGAQLISDAKINRTANPSKTPRIMLGSQYKNWVQAHFKFGDMLKIQIVSPNKIILYKKGEEV